MTSLKPGISLPAFLALVGPPDVIRRVHGVSLKLQSEEREYWIYFTGKGERLSALVCLGSLSSPLEKVTMRRLNRRQCLELFRCDGRGEMRREPVGSAIFTYFPSLAKAFMRR